MLGKERLSLFCQSSVGVQHKWVSVDTELSDDERDPLRHRVRDEYRVAATARGEPSCRRFTSLPRSVVNHHYATGDARLRRKLPRLWANA